MAKRECAKCGALYDEETDGWYECPECESSYCPDCVEELRDEQEQRMKQREEEKIKQKKEKERMEKIVETDELETYKQLVCPRCETEMTPII